MNSNQHISFTDECHLILFAEFLHRLNVEVDGVEGGESGDESLVSFFGQTTFGGSLAVEWKGRRGEEGKRSERRVSEKGEARESRTREREGEEKADTNRET